MNERVTDPNLGGEYVATEKISPKVMMMSTW